MSGVDEWLLLYWDFYIHDRVLATPGSPGMKLIFQKSQNRRLLGSFNR